MTTWQARHTMHCAERGVQPALGNGVILTLMRGVWWRDACGVSSHDFATNFGFVYAYVVMQCPLEALQGRQSLWHNVSRRVPSAT